MLVGLLVLGALLVLGTLALRAGRTCEGESRGGAREYEFLLHSGVISPVENRTIVFTNAVLPSQNERTIRGPCLGKNLGKLDCMKILIVEDEASAAAYLRRGLSEEGCAVDVASDAAQARRVVALFEL